MAGKRGPESFEKRQRERNKQQKQTLKDARRREKSQRKKDGVPPGDGENGSSLRSLPLGIVPTRSSPNMLPNVVLRPPVGPPARFAPTIVLKPPN